jgi:ribosomal protein L7/L12
MSDQTNLDAQLRALLAEGRKMEAIKRYREATGAELAAAKEAVEALERGEPQTSRESGDSSLESEIAALLEGGKKIKAVKIYRERMGTGLKEAKDAVEAIAADRHIARPSGSGCLGVVLLAAGILAGVAGALAADKPADGLFHNVACEGIYPKHLQGMCADDKDSMFWSFTDVLVKTDREGRVVKKVPVASHHGDLCFHDGKLFVAVNLRKFNDPKGDADSWVYVYRAADLSELARHKVPELLYGAGGMAYCDGRFFIIGGLPPNIEENYVYEYDKDFKFLKRHVINSGYTYLGIQTAAYCNGCWWFGCYGKPAVTLKTDGAFRMLGKYTFNCSLGIVGQRDGSLLVAQGKFLPGKGHAASVSVADADPQKGLVVRGGTPGKSP